MPIFPVNAPSYLDRKAAELRTCGFAKLEQLFPREALHAFKQTIQGSSVYRSWVEYRASAAPPAESGQVTALNTKRVHHRNDSDLAEPFFASLAEDQSFARIMTALAGRSLLRTNNHVYEIAAGAGAGLDWHVDYYSFSYTQIEDYGCTLWVPLEPITPEQRGGMQYVSRAILDGGFLYPFASWHFDLLRKQRPGPSYLEKALSEKVMINGIGEMLRASLPEQDVTEDTFDVGDALVFNKNVLHRSSPLLPGILKSRLALVCRFVDAEAKYDRERFFKTFSHLEKSALSSAAKDGAEGNELNQANEDINPPDPFLFRLAKGDARHLTRLQEVASLSRELPTRLQKR